MPPNEPQPAWIALPCICVSLFTTCAVAKAMSSIHEGGLLTVFKATCAFVIVLVVTTTAVKILLQRPPKTKPPPQSLSEDQQKASIRDHEATSERVSAWRNDVPEPTAHPDWPYKPTSKKEETWKDEKLGRKKLKKRDQEKAEEKKIQKRLFKKFAPKKHELLGGSKETVTEVLPL